MDQLYLCPFMKERGTSINYLSMLKHYLLLVLYPKISIKQTEMFLS